MKFTQISFTGADFSTLPIAERVFFVMLANVSNDLRHIQNGTVQAIGTSGRHKDVERAVATHQFVFGIRLWCAVLNEGWKVVRRGWNGSQLGKKFYNKLTSGKPPYEYLRKYFSQPNIVRTIRDRLAHHYGTEHLIEIVEGLNPGDQFQFVTTQYSGNIFYSFAEDLRILVLIATADEANDDKSLSWDESRARQAVRKLYDELSQVSDKFTTFCADVLPLIIKQCPLRGTMRNTSAVSDPHSTDSIIFIDEDGALLRPAELKRFSGGS
jgi:hypothetical protein